MVFVIGGAYQGKKEYVQAHFKGKEVFNELHLFIKRELEKGKTKEEIVEELENELQKNPDMIMIANEIGYGIVPMDEKDRRYREETGRICCILAKKASKVIRVVCGIGTVIKE